MKKKSIRHDVIRYLLSSQVIGSQKELLELLHAKGYKVTQVTVSNDLRDMRVIKQSTSEGRRLMLPSNNRYERVPLKQLVKNFSKDNLITAFYMNYPICVLHTVPGYAQGVAADIDVTQSLAVAGTVAGADTVLVVAARSVSGDELLDELMAIFPQMKLLTL